MRFVIQDAANTVQYVPLLPGTYSLGRHSSNAIVVHDALVSRHHAQVEVRPDRCIITDKGSINGTVVNGNRICAPYLLQPGDILRIGGTRIRLDDVIRTGLALAPVGGRSVARGVSGIPAPLPARKVAPAMTPRRSLTLLPTAHRPAAKTPALSRLALLAWDGARAASLIGVCGIVALLFVQPALGLALFWRIVVPLLPLLFFAAPGLWRNICPMAAMNQLPRRMGIGFNTALPSWLRTYGYIIAGALFLTIILLRKSVFNTSGTALSLLILGTLALAFCMGLLYRGKSGWCGNICPLRPVQQLYGQKPLVLVAHSHCQPCVGCVGHCPDLKPAHAYAADLQGARPRAAIQRSLFTGVFPGLGLAYFILPPTLPVYAMLGYTCGLMLLSAGLFFLIARLVREGVQKLTPVYALVALNIYYWFSLPLFLDALGLHTPMVNTAATWIARFGVLSLSILWLLRARGSARVIRLLRLRATV